MNRKDFTTNNGMHCFPYNGRLYRFEAKRGSYGDSESWTSYIVIPMATITKIASVDEHFDLTNRDIYDIACALVMWDSHYSGAGSSFANAPSMRLSESRVLLVQHGGLDI